MRTDLFFRLFVVCAFMAAVCGCRGNLDVEEAISKPKVKLTVEVPVEETKLTSSMNDGGLSNYQVYVFDDKGSLETYVNLSTSEIVLDCVAGNKTVAVLANAPVVNDVMTMSELSSRTTLLADNGNASFVMTGQQTVTLTEDKKVTVFMDRLVAKVRLSKLQVAFEAPQYQNMSFKVAAVYLINVPADITFFSSGSPGTWYNKMKYVSGDANALIYDDMKNVEVTASSPYSTTHTFYSYPNPTEEDSFSTTWTPRHTRLVVQAYLGETLYYYPVTLPKLVMNTVYDVNLTITRPGTTSPDDEVDKYAAEFSVAVKAWKTGTSVKEEI